MSSNMKQRPKASLDEALDGFPVQKVSEDHNFMDEAEQTKLVDQLRKQAESQSRWTRRPLVALFFLLGLVTAWRVALVFASPLEAMNWQTMLSKPISFEAVVATFIFQASALFCGSIIAYGVSTDTASWLLSVGGGCTVTVLILWSSILFDPGLPRVMLWIPLSGPCALLLGSYFDKDMRRMEQDVRELDKLRYNFKSL